MDLFAPKHLLLILLIALLIFGGSRLRSLGSDAGAFFRGLRKAAAGEEEARQGATEAIEKIEQVPHRDS
jgi:sec-independent protein translocase protein TatA